jgi:hypothetical protein
MAGVENGGTALITSNIDDGSTTVNPAANTNVLTYYISQYASTTSYKGIQAFSFNASTPRSFAGGLSTTSAVTSISVTTLAGTATFTGGQILIYGVK